MSKRATAELDAPAGDIAPEPAILDAMAKQVMGAYREFVRRHAEGDSIDRAELQAGLTFAGRSLVQFEADAARLKQRLAAAAVLASVEQLESDIKPGHAHLAELRAELRCLTEEFYTKAAELERKIGAAELQVLRNGIRIPDSRGKAVAVLRDTASPEILDEISRLRKSTSEGQRKNLEAKRTRNVAFIGATAGDRDRGMARIRDLEAQLHDPVAGMDWSQ